MITITYFLGTPKLFHNRSVNTVEIPTRSNSVLATKLQSLGMAGVTAKAIAVELLRLLATLEPEVRMTGDFRDRQNTPFDLDSLRQAIGLSESENDAFQKCLTLLRELGIVRVTGKDAAELEGRDFTEERIDMIEASFSDLVSKLYSALPTESTKQLAKKHVYKDLADLPEHELPAETELLDAARAYSESKEFYSALLGNKPGSKVIRAHEFIRKKCVEKRFTPAFTEVEIDQVETFLQSYPSSNSVDRDTLKRCIFFVNPKKRPEALCVQKLKNWVEGPWKMVTIPSAVEYIEKKIWASSPPPISAPKFLPEAADAGELEIVADIPTTRPSRSRQSPKFIQDFFQQLSSECLKNSHLDQAVDRLNAMPESERPSLETLAKMHARLERSYIWTYKRCFPNADIRIPGIHKIFEDRKWEKTPLPAFSDSELEVFKEHHGDPADIIFHDKIFKMSLPKEGHYRIRDNGKKEYLKPADFKVPEPGNPGQTITL